jgi:hypothetical protein
VSSRTFSMDLPPSSLSKNLPIEFADAQASQAETAPAIAPNLP